MARLAQHSRRDAEGDDARTRKALLQLAWAVAGATTRIHNDLRRRFQLEVLQPGEKTTPDLGLQHCGPVVASARPLEGPPQPAPVELERPCSCATWFHETAPVPQPELRSSHQSVRHDVRQTT